MIFNKPKSVQSCRFYDAKKREIMPAAQDFEFIIKELYTGGVKLYSKKIFELHQCVHLDREAAWTNLKSVT